MSIDSIVTVLEQYGTCKSLSPESLAYYAYHVAVNKDFMHLYTSSVATFISLSIAAIGVSAGFREKVLGQAGPLELNWLIISSWFFLALTILTGAYYLYAAPKHIEFRYQCDQFTPFGIWPGHAYGACTIFLLLGMALLFSAIVRQARNAP